MKTRVFFFSPSEYKTLLIAALRQQLAGLVQVKISLRFTTHYLFSSYQQNKIMT